MKKLLAVLMIVVMALSAFAGCASNEPAAEAPAAEAPAAEAPAAEAPAEEAAPAEVDPASIKGEVSVYVAHNGDQYNRAIEMFNEKYPNIEVLVVSAGTGDCLQRIAAEAENPQCDVMWGGTTESLEAYKQYFQPYVCAEDANIAESFKDPDDKWIGESQQPAVLMYNKKLVSEDEVPKTWAELADPKWQGKIASANPASSGSAYTLLCNIILSESKEADYSDGWAFVEQLAKNIVISGGSSSVYKGVANGEYALGLTLEQLAWVYVGSDPENCGMIYPEDGSSNVPDGFAMVANCPNPDMAGIFMDFLVSKECQQVMSDEFGRRTIRSDMEQPDVLPNLDEIYFIDYDFAWAGAGKEDVVAKWEEIAVNVISAG